MVLCVARTFLSRLRGRSRGPLHPYDSDKPTYCHIHDTSPRGSTAPTCAKIQNEVISVTPLNSVNLGLDYQNFMLFIRCIACTSLQLEKSDRIVI